MFNIFVGQVHDYILYQTELMGVAFIFAMYFATYLTVKLDFCGLRK